MFNNVLFNCVYLPGGGVTESKTGLIVTRVFLYKFYRLLQKEKPLLRRFLQKQLYLRLGLLLKQLFSTSPIFRLRLQFMRRFRLFDTGNGDADLTKNDGVYSRHLPALDDTPAKYTLTVVADDDNGKAAIVAPAIPEPHAWPIHSDLYISRKKRALAYGM
ncbi:hypothetical protein Anas_07271, partial [Armadillidium nasatum]